LVHDVDDLSTEQQETLRKIRRHLPVGVGLGYALDVSDVGRLLGTLNSAPQQVREPAQTYPPIRLQIDHSEFVALQVAAASVPARHRPGQASPIGAFSFDRTGQVFLGFSTDPGRIRLDAPDTWRVTTRQLSPTGGSFILRGLDVILYRKPKAGYKRGYWVRRAQFVLDDGYRAC
jgi:hypothetical protein